MEANTSVSTPVAVDSGTRSAAGVSTRCRDCPVPWGSSRRPTVSRRSPQAAGLRAASASNHESSASPGIGARRTGRVRIRRDGDDAMGVTAGCPAVIANVGLGLQTFGPLCLLLV